jgi:hypothetical protein
MKNLYVLFQRWAINRKNKAWDAMIMGDMTSENCKKICEKSDSVIRRASIRNEAQLLNISRGDIEANLKKLLE